MKDDPPILLLPSHEEMSRTSTDQPRLGELHDNPGCVDKYRNMLETIQANGLDNFSDYEVRFTASGYQLVYKKLWYMSSRDLAKTEPAFGRTLKLIYKAMIPTSWPLTVRQYVAHVIIRRPCYWSYGPQKEYGLPKDVPGAGLRQVEGRITA
ncbi:hypothetical protein V8F06_014426 [Rhypophila decipiens]